MSDGQLNFDDLPVLSMSVGPLALGHSPRSVGRDEENGRTLEDLDRPRPSPLSLNDRKAAARRRILTSRPAGSDRRIAVAAGSPGQTMAAIRTR